MSFKMTKDTTIRQHVTKICEIESELSYSGYLLGDEDKIFNFLNGLDENIFFQEADTFRKNSVLILEQIVSSFEITENQFKVEVKDQLYTSTALSSTTKVQRYK